MFLKIISTSVQVIMQSCKSCITDIIFLVVYFLEAKYKHYQHTYLQEICLQSKITSYEKKKPDTFLFKWANKTHFLFPYHSKGLHMHVTYTQINIHMCKIDHNLKRKAL